MTKPVQHPYYRKEPMTRRELLKRAAIGAGVVGGAGYISWAPANRWLSRRDDTGERDLREQAFDALPDFRVRPPKGTPATVVSRDANAEVGENLRRSLDAMGGLQTYIRPRDVVLLKPLVAYDRSPSLGANSQPQLIHELVSMLYRECAASEVWVTDHSIEHPIDCFRKSGIQRAVESAGGHVHIPTRNSFEKLELPEFDRIRNATWLTAPMKRATKLIGVAPARDHMTTGAAISLQNWHGLTIEGLQEFKPHPHEALAELAVAMKPTLNIIDGTRVLMEGGPIPAGPKSVRKDHAVIATHDSVGADAWAYRNLLQRDDAFPQYLSLAAERTEGGTIEARLRQIQTLPA